MIIKVFCDSCGKQIFPDAKTYHIIKEGLGMGAPANYYFCDSCDSGFQDWLKEKKNG